MKACRFKLLILGTTLYTLQAHAVTIGSDSTPQRFFTQQALNTSDRIAGFASIEAGFRLTSSAVTATFDSNFPVTGQLLLNCGTLILNRDLILNNVSTIGSLGNITGNNHVFDLSPSNSLVPTTTVNCGCNTFSNTKLVLSGDLTLDHACLTFSGSSLINGQGHTLTLNPTATIFVAANSNLLIQDIQIVGVGGQRIQALDHTSTFSFEDTALVLNGNYTFAKGRFDVLRDLRLTGSGFSFVYTTSQVSTVTTNGNLIIDEGVTFSYAPIITSSTRLRLADSSSQLTLNSGTLYTSTVGLQLTKGMFMVEGKSFLSNRATLDAQALVFGDGTTANNLSIEILPAAHIELVQGRLFFRNV
jgi:hypothetical protein